MCERTPEVMRPNIKHAGRTACSHRGASRTQRLARVTDLAIPMVLILLFHEMASQLTGDKQCRKGGNARIVCYTFEMLAWSIGKSSGGFCTLVLHVLLPSQTTSVA